MKNTLLPILFSSKPFVWLKTYEESLTIQKLTYLIDEMELNYKIFSWDIVNGLCQENGYDKKKISIENLLTNIYESNLEEEGRNEIYIFKDLQNVISNPGVKRALRNIAELKHITTPLIAISPVIDIPIECDKIFSIVTPPSLTEEEILQILNHYEQNNTLTSNMTEEEKHACVKSARGMTIQEVSYYCSKSIAIYKKISPQIFHNAKIDLIEKTNILNYNVLNYSLKDMGGNENFKEWVNEIKLCNSKEAEAFGVEPSKGFLALGLPGTSKTLSAQIIASEFNLPLLELKIEKLLGHLVGNSEKNMEKAINLIQDSSPCILLIDEIEKVFNGSSSKNDGGVMSRMLGQLLNFLSSEKSNNVFTIMTSNDISSLPPELTRSGRLDTTWYFGLPNAEERKEILKIFLNKTNLEIKENIFNYIVEKTENFTGAEIKEFVKIIVRKTYLKYIDSKEKIVNKNDIDKAINEIIPIYISSKEKILYLETYAKNRVRLASKKKFNRITAKNNNQISILKF